MTNTPAPPQANASASEALPDDVEKALQDILQQAEHDANSGYDTTATALLKAEATIRAHIAALNEEAEAHARLITAMDESLAKQQRRIEELEEALRFYDRNYTVVLYRNADGEEKLIGNFAIKAHLALASGKGEVK